MLKRIALAQMCSGVDPAVNVASLRACLNEAAEGKADILFTPEMTGLLDRDRKRAASTIKREADDAVLQAAREGAAEHQIWVSIGSLALQSDEDTSDKWVNRSFLIDPKGNIAARYDKIHLFDVDLVEEQWHESAAYAAGTKAVVAPVMNAMLGLSVCYDVRFSELYSVLSQAGATMISVPAAFTVSTGKAHWEILLRARAIETQAFVVAAAQSGHHEDGRRTYGHSMVVDPWGETLLDMGTGQGVGFCDIDMDRVEQVRSRIPAFANRRPFSAPKAAK